MKRFDDKIDRTGDCWLWQGSLASAGYGRFWYEGMYYGAHRVAWMFRHGTMPPDDMCVCHTCDNPACVNPDHLFLGTKGDNNRDRAKKGRSKGVFRSGEKHPNAKVTDEDVNAIRKLAKSGVTQSVIAERFNINQSAVSRIINSKRRTEMKR